MINKSSNDTIVDTRATRKKQLLENKKLAIKLIEKYFPKEKGHQIKYKDIHNGYTNFSFLVTFENGDQYQVRIPHDRKIINRKVEHDILFNYLDSKDFVYFDKETGIAIKKWLPGKNPGKRTYLFQTFTNTLFEQIKKLHKISLKKDSKFEPVRFDAYNKNLYRLRFIYKKKYLCLSDRRSEDPLVISHTDINPLNILYNSQDGSVELIDYEWAGLASDYFDYANYIRETGIKYKSIDWSKFIDNFDMQILEQYIFLCSVYSYLWTYAMPQTRRIVKYRLKTLKQIRKYYPAVINEDKSCYIRRDKDEKN